MLPEAQPTCPKCGGTHIAEIFYGMPREIDTDAIERGDVVYAGCRIYLGKSCRWKCNACGDRFGVIDSGSDDESESEYETIKALPPQNNAAPIQTMQIPAFLLKNSSK